MQQPPPPQRQSSLYRANRPRDLNIIDINEQSNNSIGLQPASLLTQSTNDIIHQTIQSPGYATTPNNNYKLQNNPSTPINYSSTTVNTSATSYSPHYSKPSPQIIQSAASYSNTGYQNNSTYPSTNSTTYSDQSYTPAITSAHMISNKQAQYFSFDFPSNTNSTATNNNNATNNIHSPSPYNNNNNNELNSTTTNSSRFYSNNNSTNGRFGSNYQNIPHTPVSAKPYYTTNGMMSHQQNQFSIASNPHSISVPNSPLYINNNNNNPVQPFNKMNMNMNNQLQDRLANLIDQNNNNFSTTVSTAANIESINKNVSVEPILEETHPVNEDTLIMTNTYGENDVEMVQELINDIVLKEGMTTGDNNPDSIATPPNTTTIKDNQVDSNIPKNEKIDQQQEEQEEEDNLLEKTIKNDSKEVIKSNSTNVSLDIVEKNNDNEKAYLTSNNINSSTSKLNNKNNNCDSNNSSNSSLLLLSQKNEQIVELNHVNINNMYKSVSNNKNKLKSKHNFSYQLNNKYKNSSFSESNNNVMNNNFNNSFEENDFSNLDDNLAIGGGSTSSSQACPDCNKTFTNKSALAKHRLIHSNERKYGCHLCDKAFKRQDHLNGHLLTHSDKKPFECKVPNCDKSYCDSRSLKRHVESQHQDYLALLANGNQEALNYLPSIGKIKANLAPNLQHEIVVNDSGNVIATNLTLPSNEQSSHSISPTNDIINNQKPKNFFTFEEPKPEKCKLCGKGFKNVPALNGHMRLHGGFIKKSSSSQKINDYTNPNSNNSGDNNHSNNNHDDSTSSNCSSTNSFSSGLIQQQQNNYVNNSDNNFNSSNFGFSSSKKTNFSSINFNNISNQSSTTNNNSVDMILMNQNNHQRNKLNNNKQPKRIENKIDQLFSNNNNINNNNNNINASFSQQQQINNNNSNNLFNLPNAPSHNLNHLSSNLLNISNNTTSNQHLIKKSGSLHYNLLENSSNNNNNAKYLSSLLNENQFSNNPYHQNFSYESSYFDRNNHHNSYHLQSTALNLSKASNSSAYCTNHDNLLNNINYQQFSNDTDNNNNNLDFTQKFAKNEATDIDYLTNNPSKNASHQIETHSFHNSGFIDSSHDNHYSFQNITKKSNLNKNLSDQDNSYLGNYNDQSKDEAKCTHSTSIKTPPLIIPTIPTNSTSSQVTTATSKQKNKPGPLHIPSDISAFQKQQQEQQKLLPPPQIPPYYQHQHSYQSSLSSYVYPNATLLKSPRLVSYDVKKQYTPPPMLSPFRKRPGFFYNYLTSILMMQQQQQQQQQQNRNSTGPPTLNHSMSCSYINAPAVLYSLLANNFTNASSGSNDFITNLNSSMTTASTNSSNNQDINNEATEDSVNYKNKNNSINYNDNQETPVVSNKEKEKNLNKDSINSNNNTSIHKASAFTPKPGLLRQRLLSQISSSSNGAFFPDTDGLTSEALTAALTESSEIKPFVNLGSEYQATLPKIRKFSKDDYKVESEDLLWSTEVLENINDSQFDNYVELVCKSSLIYGSSNNLELGIHILNLYNGNIKKSIKAFFDSSIDLPHNHPISKYKYSETDIWTSDEIKLFENSIFTHDKVFSEISNDVGTKTIKQCIEFYYLWKKVLSDSAKKKWRQLKKSRIYDDNQETEQQDLEKK